MRPPANVREWLIAGIVVMAWNAAERLLAGFVSGLGIASGILVMIWIVRNTWGLPW